MSRNRKHKLVLFYFKGLNYKMKIIILLCFLLSNLVVLGQKKCKYEKNEINKFTKDTVVITKHEIVYMKFMTGSAVQAMYMNGIKSLCFSFGYYSNETISKGSKVYLLLSDDSVIELLSSSTVNGKYVSSSKMYSYEAIYGLPPIAEEKLKNSVVTNIRFDFDGAKNEIEIKSKNYQKSVSEVIDCLNQVISQKK